VNRRNRKMRKLRRAVLRNEANKLNRYGYGKSVSTFHNLEADFKEL